MSSFHGPDLGPFQWDDPLLIEGQLTEEERMIRDTARDFAAKELAPRVQKAYLEEKTDPKLFRLMGEFGPAWGDASTGIRLRWRGLCLLWPRCARG